MTPTERETWADLLEYLATRFIPPTWPRTQRMDQLYLKLCYMGLHHRAVSDMARAMLAKRGE